MAADYDPARNRVLIFGGQGLGDLFYYSTRTEATAGRLTPLLFLDSFNFPVECPVMEGKR